MIPRPSYVYYKEEVRQNLMKKCLQEEGLSCPGISLISPYKNIREIFKI